MEDNMSNNKPYDICGWATKFNVHCADGRTIRPGSFDDCDGKQVPLVWQHMHDDPANVLGHAVLHVRPEGVWTEAWFNDSTKADDAKELIRNRDINSFSIYANKLKHKGHDVVHGVIREVSLVLAGANPEALIEFPVLEHGDGEPVEDEAVIYSHGIIAPVGSLPTSVFPNAAAAQNYMMHGAMNPVPAAPPRRMQMPVQNPNVLMHAAETNTQQPPQKTAEVKGGNTMPNEQNERTVRDVFNEMTDEQKNVVYFMLGEMMDDLKTEDNNMMHSAFENSTPRARLSADDYKEIFSLAKKEGSLKAGVEAFVEDHRDTLAHGVYNEDGSEQEYGIADIDYLFPDYKNITDTPEFIKRDQDWVGTVMNGVRKTPFSRIKSQFANITMDEARAKGYTKGNRKVEEVFSLLKRTTDPQTVYKKQKMDRDDILDITDFNVVAWIKKEMRLMLEEEISRAILIGDGRLSTDDNKIDPNHIRPIWGDDELYAIKAHVTAGADDAATAKAAIRTAIKARKNYKGSGNLTFYTTEDMLTEMLLLEDGIGHPLYADAAALARKLRVNRIVTVPVMENQSANGETLAGIMVDLKDYNVGADKGAGVEMFDDFDIDYNQYKYLIETRISGALVKPYSAIVLVIGGTPATYTETDDYTGNPKEKGYYEKEGIIYKPTRDTTIVEGKTYYEKG